LVAIMIGLAVLLSVCSTVDSFVALAFADSFTTGSVLAAAFINLNTTW
jgi:hypothetical protein